MYNDSDIHTCMYEYMYIGVFIFTYVLASSKKEPIPGVDKV